MKNLKKTLIKRDMYDNFVVTAVIWFLIILICSI